MLLFRHDERRLYFPSSVIPIGEQLVQRFHDGGLADGVTQSDQNPCTRFPVDAFERVRCVVLACHSFETQHGHGNELLLGTHWEFANA